MLPTNSSFSLVKSIFFLYQLYPGSSLFKPLSLLSRPCTHIIYYCHLSKLLLKIQMKNEIIELQSCSPRKTWIIIYASRIQLLDISSDKPPLKYFTNLLRIKQPSTLSVTLFILSAPNSHLF